MAKSLVQPSSGVLRWIGTALDRSRSCTSSPERRLQPRVSSATGEPRVLVLFRSSCTLTPEGVGPLQQFLFHAVTLRTEPAVPA